jgi:hypothetical protein
MGEDFHCLTSPLSVRGRYAEEVRIFGSMSQEWEDNLASLLAKIPKENIHYITAE